MTRREAVRILMFERAALEGADGGIRCAVTDLSATGARLSVTRRLPRPPLRLRFELDGEAYRLDVVLARGSSGGDVAVVFLDAPADRLHRGLAAEQRRALAAGRVNVRERRARPIRLRAPGSSA
jgi:hypothetical protein